MTQSTDSQLPGSPSFHLLADVLAVALLWVLVVTFFWRIALAGRVLAGGDVFTYFYPYWAEATRALRAGRLPLWNPYLFLGAPFLANSQVGVFYPFNWALWLLLLAHQSIHVSIVLHLCLAALNAYLWARVSLRLGRVGAWAVGATFALGGYLGAQVEHVNQLQGLAWLPIMLMLCDVALDRTETSNSKFQTPNSKLQTPNSILHSPPSILHPPSSILHLPSSPFLPPFSLLAWPGLAVVVGLVLLAGHTQTAFISLVGLAAYGLGPALWRALRWREWRLAVRQAAYLLATVGLGVALAAVQLIPTGELSRLSVRAGGLPFNERVSFSLSPLYLARALLPGFADPVPPEHIEHVAYVGIAALTLALFAVRQTQIPSSKFQIPKLKLQTSNSNLHSPSSPLHPPPSLLPLPSSPLPPPSSILLLLGLFLSLGLYNPLYLLLARFVPGFAHFRVPARWLVLAVVGLAALAGWGADTLYHRRERVERRDLVFCTVVLVVLVVWAVAGVYVGGGAAVSWRTVAAWAAGAVLALGLLLASTRVPRLATVGLLALTVVELFAASAALPHSRATASQAFTSLRPAIAHLLASRPGPAPVGGETQDGGQVPLARFVSMSDITFDPGDLPEMGVIYGPQLSADAFYDYVIAAKHKEVLSPNLPLAFGVSAVDGYGGGVLPLARYVTLQRLFLPDDQVSLDGRLRENLADIPDGRWLSLFNVRHVITDKLHDAWLDDVFYDLQFGARLSRGEVARITHVPHFEGMALGIVSHLDGGAAVADGTTVGVVEVGLGQGITRTFDLRAGQQTAEALYGPQVAHAQATVGGHFWLPALDAVGQEPRQGNDYVTRLRWEEPAVPSAVVVRATLPQGELVVRGVSLIDERTGGFQALVISDRGHFRLAHSGDVKIYENLDVLPRAFLVHEWAEVVGDEAALAAMQAASFDPAVEVALSAGGGAPLAGSAGTGPAQDETSSTVESARIAHYAPERVEVEVTAAAPAYLVLTDAWYPDWEATVDGEPAPVRRADLFFRAVAVPAGVHRVVFAFRPVSLFVGVGVSLAGVAGLIGVTALALSKGRRNAIMDRAIDKSSKEGNG